MIRPPVPPEESLLHHLVVNEPIVAGARFKSEKMQDIQDAQSKHCPTERVAGHSEVRGGVEVGLCGPSP